MFSYSRSQEFIGNTASAINSGNAYVYKEKSTRPSVRFIEFIGNTASAISSGISCMNEG